MDNKYNFEFDLENTVSVYPTYIYISRAVIEMLDGETKVNIGLDIENKVLCIKKADNDTNKRIYAITQYRTQGIKLIRAIKNITTKTTFKARYDKDLNMVLVDLTEGAK